MRIEQLLVLFVAGVFVLALLAGIGQFTRNVIRDLDWREIGRFLTNVLVGLVVVVLALVILQLCQNLTLPTR